MEPRAIPGGECRPGPTVGSGDLQAAHAAAQQLLRQCQAAGDEAYPQAAYDTTMAYSRFGRELKKGGAAEGALAPLDEAQRRFQALADAGTSPP